MRDPSILAVLGFLQQLFPLIPITTQRKTRAFQYITDKAETSYLLTRGGPNIKVTDLPFPGSQGVFWQGQHRGGCCGWGGRVAYMCGWSCCL